MATVSQETQIYKETSPLFYPTVSTSLINQGDQVYFDTSAKVVKAVASNGNVATFAGVALQQSSLNVYGTTVYPQGGIQVATRGIFTFKTTAAETYAQGDPVYLGADAQTISNVDPGAGTVLGFIWFRIGQTSLTGAAGVNVEVLIKTLYPFLGV